VLLGRLLKEYCPLWHQVQGTDGLLQGSHASHCPRHCSLPVQSKVINWLHGLGGARKGGGTFSRMQAMRVVG
jgi:hypothetical protein